MCVSHKLHYYKLHVRWLNMDNRRYLTLHCVVVYNKMMFCKNSDNLYDIYVYTLILRKLKITPRTAYT